VRQVYLQYRPHTVYTQQQPKTTAFVIEKNQPNYSRENGKVVPVNTMKKYKVGGAVQLHPFLTTGPV